MLHTDKKEEYFCSGYTTKLVHSLNFFFVCLIDNTELKAITALLFRQRPFLLLKQKRSSMTASLLRGTEDMVPGTLAPSTTSNQSCLVMCKHTEYVKNKQTNSTKG